MEIRNTLGPWLGKTSKMLSCLINEVFQEHAIDLTREQWVLLMKLHQRDSIPQNQLAFITERDKTSLTRLVKTMERKGLIMRKTSEKDKRSKLVCLTKNGINTYTKATPLLKNTIEELQKGLNIQEIEQTIQTLQKLQNNINAISTHCALPNKI